MGEMPMIVYLLAGYTCLLLSLHKSGWLILLAALFWGIAVKTKAQAVPFWMISLVIPLLFSVIKRWARPIILLSVGIILAWLVSSGIE